MDAWIGHLFTNAATVAVPVADRVERETHALLMYRERVITKSHILRDIKPAVVSECEVSVERAEVHGCARRVGWSDGGNRIEKTDEVDLVVQCILASLVANPPIRRPFIHQLVHEHARGCRPPREADHVDPDLLDRLRISSLIDGLLVGETQSIGAADQREFVAIGYGCANVVGFVIRNQDPGFVRSNGLVNGIQYPCIAPHATTAETLCHRLTISRVRQLANLLKRSTDAGNVERENPLFVLILCCVVESSNVAMCTNERIPQRIGLYVVIVRAVKEQCDVERLGAGHQSIAHQRASFSQRRDTARHTPSLRHRVGPFEAHCVFPPSRYNRFHS
ncbi:hypothetical protein BamMEX5DRAFT_4622 [Burkholderia ambifaria MEX-5]|uniref:Uncharacterized protein n=1 Tax=Burkholderia ambifaria MEX-5 TaxID=396597 RepID=B1TA06_9BURK|nr:hypothetical protein BamMEX5DRAFT_4622 [Burkholderia ambifaria MEX-5]